MAKNKTVYVCASCGAESPKWMGRCAVCGEWDSLKQFTIHAEKKPKAESVADLALGGGRRRPIPVALSEVNALELPRLETGDGELDRVLGGGLVPGSLILLGGEPGIGKSTLLLQTVLKMPRKILYISGEESEQQIRMRADRLGDVDEHVWLLCETNLEQIFAQIKNSAPEVVVVDSIQTLASETQESAAGSVTQIRECAAALLKYAKESGVPVILVGHITKDGVIAGPKVLEHIVDTVLQFEGDRHHLYRILRSIKNRFGSTSELGIYEMRSDGLRKVDNPSELFLMEGCEDLSGMSVCAAVEGVRPFLIEVQALVSTAAYGTPQRSATGFDTRRLNMLLAVLEKRIGFKLGQKDVFLNIAGGLKVNDPAIDLSVITSVLSSNVDTAIDRDVALAGEVGLSGEIRPVTRIAQRVAEAEKLGFKQFVLPQQNVKTAQIAAQNIELVPVATVTEALRALFG